jgi:hypothetical protein
MAQRLDGAYWGQRWENGQTAWRDLERGQSPFERNAKLLVRVLHGTKDDASPKAVDIKKCLNKATVFIPLCGDTPALSYWAKELGARVIGVDIVEASLRRAITEQFPDREVNESGPDAKGLRRFELPPKHSHEGPVTLYCGDAFALMANRQEYLDNIDIVYDRAALVALQPDLYPKYVEYMKSLMQVHDGDASSQCQLFAVNGRRTRRAMWLTTIERPLMEMSQSGAPSAKGPPFHVGEDEVFQAYTNATGGTTRFVTPVFNDRHLFEKEEKPEFVEAHYVVVAQRDDHPHPTLDAVEA